MSIRKSFDSEAARAIGRRIKEARGEITQAEFATVIGVDRATLSNYETGRRIPNSDIIKQIELVACVPDNFILIGNAGPKEYIDEGFREYQNEFIRQSQRTPGFYPKWFFSDFEIALLRCLRACPDFKKKAVVQLLISEYKSFIEAVNAPFGDPIPEFEEQSLSMIEAAAEDGDFPSGTDVERVLWSYFKRVNFAASDSVEDGAQ